MTRHSGLALGALAVIIGVAPAAPSEAQAVDPAVVLDRTGTADGEVMLVSGQGWSPGATLVVELCGRGGLGGSASCDVANQRTAGVGPRGTFAVQLTSARPPVPCPCVVRATDQQSRIAATAPIAVAGVPTVPVTEADLPPTRSLEISSVELGGRSWTELFGAPGTRVLDVTLVNTGAVALDPPDVSIAWGRGDRPDGFVEPPATDPMEPGATQRLRIELDRPGLTIGEMTAVVEVQGIGDAVTATATTTGHPWGLLAGALVIVQLVLLRVRNAVRRRLAHRSEAEHTGGEGAGAPSSALAAWGPSGAHGISAEARALGPATIAAEPALPIAAPEPLVGGAAARPAPPAPVAAELDLVRRNAQLVLKQAVALSEALVAAAGTRLAEVEEAAAASLRAADERRAEAIALLDAARRQADQLTAAAAGVAAAALQEAAEARSAAHRALAELEDRHRSVAEAASEAVRSAIADLGEQGDDVEQRQEIDLRERRPDELDRRLARAVTRALTDAAHGNGTGA